MRKGNKIKSFQAFVKENLDEFVTSIMSEEEFTDTLDSYRDKGAFVNDDILLTKAREDGFKGDLKPVRSKKSGNVVLIYRPSINIGSTLAVAESNEENQYYYIFVGEDEFDEYGDPEDGYEIGYSVMDVYMIPREIDEHDNALISEIEDEVVYDKDVEPVAKAKVKFWEGSEMTEVLEIVSGDKNIDVDKITLLYPEL